MADEDLAVEAQNLLHLLETFQERIVPLSAGVLAAACLGNFLARGPVVLPAMVQLGFCMGWVVWAMYTGIINGLLFDLWKWLAIPLARLRPSSSSPLSAACSLCSRAPCDGSPAHLPAIARRGRRR